MEPKINYFSVGISVILLLIALLFVVLWLSVGISDKKHTTYAVYMNEPVSGLTVESPVKFNGVLIGVVKEIDLNHKNPQQVLLLLDVEADAPIASNTSAVLQSQGITGVRYVELIASGQNATPLEPIEGEPYPIIPSRPSLLVQLDTALREFTENFGRITDSISHVLDKDNAIALKATLRNLETVSGVVAGHSKKISETIIRTEKVSEKLAVASESLPQIITSFKKAMKSIEITAQNFQSASRQVNTFLHSGQTAMDTFSYELAPGVSRVANEFEIFGHHASELAQDLNRQPSMIIRGKSQAPLGPGE